MDFENVRELLREVIGSGIEVISGTLLKEMLDYRVWEVQTQKPDLRLVVKLAGPRAVYTSAFERTAALHRLVRAKTSVPIPEVIAADESCQKWPWRYLIKTYLPGIPWADVAKRVPGEALDTARFDLGNAVAALHELRFAGFGELDLLAEIPEPLPYPEALARRVWQMIPSPDRRDYILTMLAAHAGLFRNIQAATLCHEDFHWYNLLLDEVNREWRLAAILDFEKAWAGDREIDLARMDLWGMTGGPFWKAYQEHRLLDSGYTERKALYQLIWCVEYAENSREHLELTQGLCRELGMPVIESFAPFVTSRFSLAF